MTSMCLFRQNTDNDCMRLCSHLVYVLFAFTFSSLLLLSQGCTQHPVCTVFHHVLEVKLLMIALRVVYIDKCVYIMTAYMCLHDALYV